MMRQHASRMAFGAAVGVLLGASYPVFSSGGAFNAVPALTAEYGLVGATLGFTLSNYLAFRQRIQRRIAESQQSHRSD